MNPDIAGVIAQDLTLDDILAMRLVERATYAAFKIPQLAVFYDFRGNIICARRHNYTAHFVGHNMIPSYYGSFIPTHNITLPTPAAVKGFPLIVLTDVVQFTLPNLQKIFGILLTGLPVYYFDDGACTADPSRYKDELPGTPLISCQLIMYSEKYGGFDYKFVRDGPQDRIAKHITLYSRFCATPAPKYSRRPLLRRLSAIAHRRRMPAASPRPVRRIFSHRCGSRYRIICVKARSK